MTPELVTIANIDNEPDTSSRNDTFDFYYTGQGMYVYGNIEGIY